MKIAYITSIDTDLNRASSNQVSSMLLAFSLLPSVEFYAGVVTENTKCNSSITWPLELPKFFKKRMLKLVTPFLFLKKVRENNINAIYCRESFIALVFCLLKKNVIFEIHELVGNNSQGLILYFLTKMKNVSFVTVSNSGLRDFKIRHPNASIFSLPNGVFVSDYDSSLLNRDYLRKKLFPKHYNDIIYVYTGSLHKGNDANILFEIASVASKRKLFIIGGTREEFEKLQASFELVGNIEHIPFLPQKEVINYQIAADALCYPISKSNSISEHTSPLKLFEYMATKNPIIGTRLGAVKEILSSKNAYLFDDNNSIESALSELEFDLREGNSSKADFAYDLVRKNYSWESRVREIVRIFGS